MKLGIRSSVKIGGRPMNGCFTQPLIFPQGDPTGQSTAVAFNVVSQAFSSSQLMRSPGSSASQELHHRKWNCPGVEGLRVRATDLAGSKLESPSLGPASKVTTVAEGTAKKGQ